MFARSLRLRQEKYGGAVTANMHHENLTGQTLRSSTQLKTDACESTDLMRQHSALRVNRTLKKAKLSTAGAAIIIYSGAVDQLFTNLLCNIHYNSEEI